MTKISTLMAALILIGCGLLIAAPASAMSPKPGQACIMWICWDKPNQWKPNYGGRADAGEYTGANDTVVAMMTPEMLENWRASLRKYSGATIDLDGWDSPTQFARGRGRDTTCSANPYGRRSAYCANPEVEAPVEQTTAFGQCLLDDQPVELETLTDCRSDACLGRKFYYGPVGRVGR